MPQFWPLSMNTDYNFNDYKSFQNVSVFSFWTWFSQIGIWGQTSRRLQPGTGPGINAVTWDIVHNCPYNQAWFAETLNVKGQGCSPLMILTGFWTRNLRKDSMIMVFISLNSQLQLKNELAHRSLRSKVSANASFWPLDRKYSQSNISIFQTNQRRCTLIIKNKIYSI